jgi:hypothetical protein
MDIALNIAGRQPVTFRVDETAKGRCFFVLGIRKCGSTLFNKICRPLALQNSTNYVDVAGTFFKSNITVGEWVNDAGMLALLRPGNAYGGFRAMPKCFQEARAFENGRKILLIRDPRDALVSEYFSNAYSHQIPKAAPDEGGARSNLLTQRQLALDSSIDEYVTSRAKLMRRTFSEYKFLFSDPMTKIFKYEDVISHKRDLIRAILAHFRWSAPDSIIDKLLERVDVLPTSENPTAFIRRVTPGDHREKLTETTITEISIELQDVLDFCGYSS